MRRAALAVLLLALGTAGCGGGSSSGAARPTLAWVKPPQLVRVGGLPHDAVIIGRVRNGSGRALVLDARTVAVRDARGAGVRADARFLTGFAHGIYSPQQFHGVQNPFELARTGVRIELHPGETKPLTVAYRLRRGQRAPRLARFGAVTLTLPQR